MKCPAMCKRSNSLLLQKCTLSVFFIFRCRWHFQLMYFKKLFSESAARWSWKRNSASSALRSQKTYLQWMFKAANPPIKYVQREKYFSQVAEPILYFVDITLPIDWTLWLLFPSPKSLKGTASWDFFIFSAQIAERKSYQSIPLSITSAVIGQDHIAQCRVKSYLR